PGSPRADPILRNTQSAASPGALQCCGVAARVGKGVGVYVGSTSPGVQMGRGVRRGVGDGVRGSGQFGAQAIAARGIAHSSRPCTLSLAVEKRWVPETMKLCGVDERASDAMSCTIVVPDAVPSLCQSSKPCAP